MGASGINAREPATFGKNRRARPGCAWANGGDFALPNLERQSARLVSLDRLDTLQAPRDEAFDRITQLAKKLFGVPVAVVSLTEAPHQWHESDQEASHLRPSDTPSLIGDGRPVVVVDAKQDRRFADNPFVLSEPGLRFYAGVPLTTSNGHTVGSLCLVDMRPRDFGSAELEIMLELAELVVNEMELRLSAMKDGLTGALSRQSFKEELLRAAALANRYDYQLSCVAIDLDRFKSINDTYGHAAGDSVLANTIRACAEQLRVSDFIGRMGGEEFAILLPYTGLHGAIEVAERLRCSIEELPIATKSQVISVTASFGVAVLEDGDADAMMRHADEALYEAKASGRNRCVAWLAPAHFR